MSRTQLDNLRRDRSSSLKSIHDLADSAPTSRRTHRGYFFTLGELARRVPLGPPVD